MGQGRPRQLDDDVMTRMASEMVAQHHLRQRRQGGMDMRASRCDDDANEDDNEMARMASAMAAQHRRRQ